MPDSPTHLELGRGRNVTLFGHLAGLFFRGLGNLGLAGKSRQPVPGAGFHPRPESAKAIPGKKTLAEERTDDNRNHGRLGKEEVGCLESTAMPIPGTPLGCSLPGSAVSTA